MASGFLAVLLVLLGLLTLGFNFMILGGRSILVLVFGLIVFILGFLMLIFAEDFY
ncbi:MAG: hypothetical protein SV377_01135 [Halobacteria archaeon]|nr:hypothetical protein [Halobacteria archaeon]